MVLKKQKICSRCILDTTVPDIRFDEKGVCNYCKIHDDFEKKYPLNAETEKNMAQLVERIKKDGKNKKYDCIVGVSGGTDSTYCVYLTHKWGLRPLAVHLDNGWDSELAVNNIKLILSKLDIDLYTSVLNWEEFKDLQIAFLKASVPDIEIPTDIAIYAILYNTAAKYNVKWVVNGHSFRTEGTSPLRWTYMDGKYIESVYKKFGKNKKLRTFPNLKISNLLNYMFVKKIKEFRPLEYINYDKQEMGKFLTKEFGWTPSGGIHYESTYTRFLHSYILIKKFNIDYRKVTLSASVRSGKITRDDALNKLKILPVSENQIKEDMNYVIKKLNLSEKEFKDIMNETPKSFLDYSTNYQTIRKLRIPIKLACKFNLLPKIFYEKYFDDYAAKEEYK